MPRRFTVVVSQGQSHNPKKRAVEEAIVGGLLGERGVDVALVPHLYNLQGDTPEVVGLQSVASDLIVCSWIYPRAARWTLDRHGVRGAAGESLIPAYGQSEDDDDEAERGGGAERDDKPRVIDTRPTPRRSIYCLDLRTHDSAEPYLAEVRRIMAEGAVETVSIGGVGLLGGLASEDSAGAGAGAEAGAGAVDDPAHSPAVGGAARDALAISPASPAVKPPPRRWYPVIDYSRCTNCMECIDFCLFGVYGLDAQETLLVEQPDNCRKGCPACSRVCPENAIMFPQHKTPTIAGSPEVGGPMKIDLSKLFGAPDPGAPGADKAVDVAVRERDEQLLKAGRDLVGASVGVPKRQEDRGAKPRDALDGVLDGLLDELDGIDL
ncbi:MAG: ferredoxin family protein [Planctomycetota bacterium]